MPQTSPNPQQRSSRRAIAWTVLTMLGLVCAEAALARDYVTLRRDGHTTQVDGRLILTAQDGGILFMARDGVIWNILPEEQVKHTRDDQPFEPLKAEALSKAVLAQLPKGFEVYQTAHYLIVYDTSRAYAQWCGSLFERLYSAFRNSWKNKGFELEEPEFPLVAIVFSDKKSYAKFSESALGEAVESITGYFNLSTNQMVMCDLTGTSASGRSGRLNSIAQINQTLAQPEATQMVATIVHEATHQIAFNCGLQTRLSDCPLWFTEGIAVYFETPDLRSAKGWAGVGAVNRPRLAQFQQYLGNRPADSLETLIANDRRFRDLRQGLDTYAEAWALTYYLLKQRPKEYVEYLKLQSKKPPLIQDGPEKRLKEFEKCFGPLKKLDHDFLRFMSRLR